jgi:pimeloyl-ACP methyl ester carboxylesterase
LKRLIMNNPAVSLPAGIESRFLEVNGQRLHYFRAGAGPAVIFIHGGASDARDWLGTMASLAGRYRLYAPDLCGFGESDRDEKGYYLKDFNDCLYGFIEALKIPAPVLAGHSFGGRMCLEMAHLHPEKISKLILIDAAGVGNVSLVGRTLFGGFAAARQAMGKRQPFPKMMAKPGEDYNDIGEAALKNLKVPTLLIWKSLDPYMPLKLAQRAVKLIPGAKLKVLEGYGHAPHQQKDHNEFIRILGEFLDGKDAKA